MESATDALILAPDFGSGVAHLPLPCTPRMLFLHLQDPEENVHYFEPAYHFASAALAAVEPDCPPPGGAATRFVDDLVALADPADPELSAHSLEGRATAWAARVVREFAPIGLTDGTWLQGAVRVNAVENEVGMLLLKQLMIRFSDPGMGEPYSQRYASLLQSTGVPPASIVRWDHDESAPCTDISYEHALLGTVLGLFPTTFRHETIGFNLWMASIGPCPLLVQIADELRGQRANLSYIDMHDYALLASLAKSATLALLAESDTHLLRTRIAKGFLAAHRSYSRWKRAMFGRNIPMRPRDFVEELVQRNARFAMGHHSCVMAEGRKLDSFFGGTKSDHVRLVDWLAASKWVQPGAPDESRLLTHSISLDGPMFEVFSASEQCCLRDWIARIGTPDDTATDEDPIPLEGVYTHPQDPESLRRYALEHFAEQPLSKQYYFMANADRHPPVRVYAKSFVEMALNPISAALDTDQRLNAISHPNYSERLLAEMVADNHVKNVRSRRVRSTPKAPETDDKPGIGLIFDGCWLQGFANVQRIHLEEYGWLFRIYASELGDGTLTWNHNVIARNHLRYEEGISADHSAADPQLYDEFETSITALLLMACSLNTQRFLPEVLAINLAIEATGVGGLYITNWKKALKSKKQWIALYFRLHNSIDNYASGHTKWSIAAVQAFMARVAYATPEAIDQQWRRIWRLWRLQEIRLHGTRAEREALAGLLGTIAISGLGPTEA